MATFEWLEKKLFLVKTSGKSRQCKVVEALLAVDWSFVHDLHPRHAEVFAAVVTEACARGLVEGDSPLQRIIKVVVSKLVSDYHPTFLRGDIVRAQDFRLSKGGLAM